MGRYIDDILQPGEKVLYSTNAHWMFYLPAIAAWIVAIILFFLSRWTTTEGIVLLCLSAAAVVAIVALYWTAKSWFIAGPPRPTSPTCGWSTRPGSSSGAPSR